MPSIVFQFKPIGGMLVNDDYCIGIMKDVFEPLVQSVWDRGFIWADTILSLVGDCFQDSLELGIKSNKGNMREKILSMPSTNLGNHETPRDGQLKLFKLLSRDLDDLIFKKVIMVEN